MKKNTWICQIFLWTFILSITFSYITNIISTNSTTIVTAIIILIVIAVGILFDMLGASCLTSKESTFHAMGAKKIKGAKQAIKLIRNNVKVSSVCNDIVGDICGIISGGLGAVLAIDLANNFEINLAFITMITSAVISALTVGGKAMFKKVAIKNSDKILFRISKIICFFKRK
ncbi:MAG: hypothetical protein E7164_01035 [Firmicutes bacterium]|nr:hypothetical protein [Bacillota bacterium]